MNRIGIYCILCIFFSVLLSCSGDEPGDPSTDPDPDPVWDKTRSMKVSFLSDLTGNNPFTVSSYSTVASYVKEDESHLLILDKVHVRYAPPRMHPGAEIAVLAERVPLFVPTAIVADSYMGSVLLLMKPLQQMEMTPVTDDCRLMQTRIEIKPGLSMHVAIASFNQAEQVIAASTLLKRAVEQSVLVAGTIRRDDLPQLRSTLSSGLQESTYELTIAEISNSNSTYCIYILGSKEWKFRNMTETNVQGTIKNWLLEVEYLK